MLPEGGRVIGGDREVMKKRILEVFGIGLIVLIYWLDMQGCLNYESLKNAIGTVGVSQERGSQMGTNEKSFTELAAELRELGIQGLTDEVVAREEEHWNKMVEEYGEEVTEGINKAGILLTMLGMGKYDFDNFTWTPTSEQVYCFDAEAFDMGCMYTRFLEGVSAIGDGEFEITQVVEDTSQINYDTDEGKQVVSFCLNGKSYSYEAEFQGDWMDLGIMNYMNEIFEEQGTGKKLYSMCEDGQTFIVFYCTEEWAEKFSGQIGCELECGVA